jgi:VWFA-related protein
MFPALSTIKPVQFVTRACLPVCLLLCLLVGTPVGHGQNPQDPPPPPEPKRQTGQDQSEVLRVYTELIQTDVMVFHKDGRFVDNLKASDFELRIDGTTKPVEFFEKITAGSQSEELQLAAARGAATRPNSPNAKGPAPLDRGRPIFFYVDDLHLDPTSLQTTRKLITSFIDNQMGQNDEAAIASASGQIGFLQQLTDNKIVLHAALDRLKYRPYTVRDLDRPVMTEYQALQITNYDRDLTDFFIDATIRQNPGTPREVAESMVNARAKVLVQQAGSVTTNTLTGLEGLIRSASKLPGRKLVFFVSAGFFLDDTNSDSRTRLQRITSAAAHSGVVIYSMDARGLVASLGDISSPSEFDVSGTLQRGNGGELIASQESLSALAADTGGRAIFNSNSLGTGLGRALKETSTYYLLAWKPDRESQQSKFRRIEVKVVGRPDLIVKVRRGFFDREPEIAKTTKGANSTKAKKEPEPAKSPEAELRKVILSPYPEHDIPLSLNLSYLNVPTKGLMLSTALQVPNEFLSFVPTNGKQTAVVVVAGTVFDDKGNAGAGFSNRITIEAPSVEATKDGRDLTYGYPVYIKPGLYQVRVGVRDETSGRSGSAHGWIQIPDLATGQLALSSVLMGLRSQTGGTTIPAATADTPPNPVALSINHHFSPDGFLRFLFIVYNATPAAGDAKPDVAVQIQIVRDEQPVTTTPLKKISVDGLADLTRIPYAAEISLAGLPAGHYILQVTVVDRVGKKSASQQNRFEID